MCKPDMEAYALLRSEEWSTCAGIDTGVFLIRNSPFIREFLSTLERQARILPMPSAPVGHFAAHGIHRKITAWLYAFALPRVQMLTVSSVCFRTGIKGQMPWLRQLPHW